MKKLTSILLLSFALSSFAQEKDKKWSYGFEVGANYSNVIGRDKSNGPGYELGISTKRALSDHLFFNPIISFGYSSARHKDNPLLDYYLNFQPKLNYYLKEDENSLFFSFAPAYQRRLSSPVLGTDYTKRNNFSLNFGLGLLNKFQFFDLQTELRYSFGLTEKLHNPTVPVGPGFKPESPVYFHSIGIYFQFL